MKNDDVRLDFHEGTLRVRGVSAKFVAMAQLEETLVWDPREGCFRCDAFRLDSLQAQLRDALADDVSIDCTSLHTHPELAISNQLGTTLRSDQLDAVEAFERDGRRGLIVMPTGTGKTVVAIEIMIRCQTSTLIVVPVRDLMYQWHAKILAATGIDAGLIGDGVHRVSPISIATYDSAAIHTPRIGDRFNAMIFDEVHHLPSPFRSDAARMSVASIRLGLTATPPTDPERLRCLSELIGPTVYQQEIQQASGKTLAGYRIRRMAVELSPQERKAYDQHSRRVQAFVSEQRDIDRHFRWQDIHGVAASVDENPQRASGAREAIDAFRAKTKIEEHATGKFRVLEDLFRLHADEPVIVFAGSNVMAREISLRFLVPCLLSHCRKKERQEWLKGFAQGRYPVLVANRVLDEGVDLPAVNVAIVVGGLSSQRQAIQRLGRVLRRDSLGNAAVLYEVVTNGTREVKRSRDRRRNSAYRQTPQGNRSNPGDLKHDS